MATIDVTEILKASTAGQPFPKRAKYSDGAKASDAIKQGKFDNLVGQSSIMAALDEMEDSSLVQVDEAHVKKLVSLLEKKMLKNREMRVKSPDDPKKFMDSEIELDTSIQELHALATAPNLYPVFISSNGVELLLQLLGHENTDIVTSTLNLLQELTDVDTLNESDEGAQELVESLAQGSIITTILSCFDRLDESIKDEADGVHNALSVIENMIDFRPATTEDAANQGLLVWLLKRCITKTPFDANKMYASELLSMLLQESETAKVKLTEKADGIDILLRAIAAYKKIDPENAQETEHMENLFNALCAALMHPPNRKKFLDGEGLQLMNLMLREKKQSRQSALKVLDHATSGPEGVENCNKLVEMLGLRTLFPLYMRTPSSKKRKDTTPDEHEEHVCAILSSLLRSCTDATRERIMQKFVEHEHEKVDRAVELFLKYREKLIKFEAKSKKNGSGSSNSSDMVYLDRLDNGLYTQQRISLILADVCTATPSALKRAEKLIQMKLRDQKLDVLLNDILGEYVEELGDDADDERDRVQKIMEKLVDGVNN